MCRYGKLAWKWHPLKNLAYQFDANVTFKKIAEAYEILSDGMCLHDDNEKRSTTLI